MRSHRLIPAVLAVLLAALAPTDVSARPGSVLVTDLGTLGGSATFALDINNARQVTGNSRTTDGQLVAFLWQGGHLANLGFLPGGNGFSRGYAVGPNGVVVGESDNNRPRAFRWEGGVMTDVGTLPGGSTAVAHDVNGTGDIVGAASNGLATRPFVAVGGSEPVDLGTLAGTPTSSGRAWAVNDRGDVAGLSRNAADNTSEATLWPEGTPGSAVSLGSLGEGLFSQAYALNNQRSAVGESSVPSGDGHAVVWPGAGTPVDLGTLGFRHSRANDINERGEIVGHVTAFRGAPTFGGRAVLWRAGDAVDLNELLPPGSPWVLHSAEGINDRGDVVGFGRLDGELRSFLLNVRVARS